MRILNDIINDEGKRSSLIAQFQEEVWNGNAYGFKGIQLEILKDLAYDLDYYQGNPEIRREEPSYYGNEQLEKEIKEALAKLKSAQ